MDPNQERPGYRFNPFTKAWEPDPAQSSSPVPAEPPAAASRGAGRPALGADKRTRRIGLSVSQTEHDVLAELARRDGAGSLAKWVRDRLISALTLQSMGHATDLREVARLRADLAKVGSNLNQIARAVNVAERSGSEGPSSGELLAAIDATRRELEAVRAWTREVSS